jgi:toxin ParE1/3/4
VRHVVSQPARAELDAIWKYVAVASRSSDTADRLIESITRHFYLIAKQPGMGRPRDELRPGYRSFPVGQYLIFYRVLEKQVEIMHVLHGKRDLDAMFE